LNDLEDLGFPSPEPPPDLDDVTSPAEEEQAYTAFDDYSHTLKELGACFDVSRERIRQIIGNALSKLRRMDLVKEMWGVRKETTKVATINQPVMSYRSAQSRLVCERAGFRGCSCGAYARTSAGAVYCRWCGNVWRLEERIARIVVTNAMIERWETTEGSAS